MEALQEPAPPQTRELRDCVCFRRFIEIGVHATVARDRAAKRVAGRRVAADSDGRRIAGSAVLRSRFARPVSRSSDRHSVVEWRRPSARD